MSDIKIPLDDTAKAIRHMMAHAHISQVEMANKAGIHKNTISRAVDGNPVSLKMLQKIANTCGCEINFTVTIPDKKTGEIE